jgi:hypothetical protein
MNTNEETRLVSVEADGIGRYYQSPTNGKWFPSVTTVVNHRDAEKWKQWREDPANQKTSEAAIQRGNALHLLAEEYLTKGTIPTTPEDRKYFDPLFPLLKNINEIYAIERPLWSDNLMIAGRTDCIGEYLGEPAIIDFKTASKEKRKSWITNYFHQAAAYSYMWEERTGQRINNLVVLITTSQGTSQEFVESREDHKEGLGEVIRAYWSKYKFKQIQEIANELAKKIS